MLGEINKLGYSGQIDLDLPLNIDLTARITQTWTCRMKMRVILSSLSPFLRKIFTFYIKEEWQDHFVHKGKRRYHIIHKLVLCQSCSSRLQRLEKRKVDIGNPW